MTRLAIILLVRLKEEFPCNIEIGDTWITMSPERRCCCYGCAVLSDNFTRPNNTNLGDNWDEKDDHDVYGYWEIKDGMLQEVGNDGISGVVGAAVIGAVWGSEKFMGVFVCRRDS